MNDTLLKRKMKIKGKKVLKKAHVKNRAMRATMSGRYLRRILKSLNRFSWHV